MGALGHGRKPPPSHKIIVVPQISCALFRETFTMAPLSPYDDSLLEDDPQKTQGGGEVENKSNNV